MSATPCSAVGRVAKALDFYDLRASLASRIIYTAVQRAATTSGLGSRRSGTRAHIRRLQQTRQSIASLLFPISRAVIPYGPNERCHRATDILLDIPACRAQTTSILAASLYCLHSFKSVRISLTSSMNRANGQSPAGPDVPAC